MRKTYLLKYSRVGPMFMLKKFLLERAKTLKSQAANIFISQCILAALFIVADIIFARNLSVQYFAYWKQLFLTFSLAVPLLTLGFPEGFKYFLAKEKNAESEHLSSAFLLLILSTLAIATISFIFGKNLWIFIFKERASAIFVFFLPFVFFSFTLNKMLRYVAINFNATRGLIRAAIYSCVIGAILIWIIIFFFQTNVNGFITSCSIMLMFCYSVSVGNVLTKAPVELRLKINWKSISKFLNIGFPLYLATFMGIICLNIDKLIVSHNDSLTNFAIFSVGAIEVPIFSMISASASQTQFPHLVFLISRGDLAEARKCWLNYTVKISYITYPLIALLMFSSSALIPLIFGEEYRSSTHIFKTFLLIGLWRNNYYGALISASGRTRWITLYSAMNLIVNISLAVFLFRIQGMMGVAYSALLATTLMNVLQLQHEKILLQYIKTIVGDWKIVVLIIIISVGYIL